MGDMSPIFVRVLFYALGQLMPRARKHVPDVRTDRNSIGPMVARLRRGADLTQEELAGRCQVVGWEVSRDAIKRIERGEREVTDIELRKLAAALRTTPAAFFEVAEKPKRRHAYLDVLP